MCLSLCRPAQAKSALSLPDICSATWLEMHTPAGRRKALDARGDVHPITEEIAIVGDDVAEVDANTEIHPLGFGQGLVKLAQLVLDLDRAPGSFDRACEFGNDAVARGPENAAAPYRNV